ncbi:ATP-binding protein [Pedobacter arcticus]|uniref:ATP-binding protein n=1 Tax=Pedobacter arcticus TaxID=752140 RepID=UPI0002F3BC92|nr:ATP-binding protein [Pedobacter arcticus]
MQNEKKSAMSKTIDTTTNDEQTDILEAAGLTGVCTDEHLNVIKAFGDTTIYLKNDNFNFQLTELLPDNIALIIKAAAHQTLEKQEPIALNDLDFSGGDFAENYFVNVLISPLPTKNNTPQLLVLFSSNKKKHKNKFTTSSGDHKKLNMNYLTSLEREIEDAKNKLNTAYELVNSSNENIQSFNEELQSANEEMHSSNEELQSVNEELQTINKEQQQTNAELTESNNDLNNYFRSNTNGQLFVDHNLMLKRYSAGTVKHINLQKSDIGRPFGDITTNIKLETLVADVKQVMLDGQIIVKEAESSDGKMYQVMTMPYVLKDTGKTDGAIISFYDITEFKKLLAALDISNKSLTDSVAIIESSREQLTESLAKEKQLNVLKSRFVSMASHEFKTPLTAIQLSAALIGKVALDSDNIALKKYAETIKNAVKNLTNILNDFLSVEILETGKINPILNTLDMVEFAEEIAEDMESLTKKEQQITYKHTGVDRMVTLNSSMLKNGIINLISNAIKYSGPESLIEFSTTIIADELTIVIKDNGMGIPDKDQLHLFEPFYRAQNIGNIPGTGLGLNIVSRYTAMMNGKIKFESKLGEGTTFTLVFPVKPIDQIA